LYRELKLDECVQAVSYDLWKLSEAEPATPGPTAVPAPMPTPAPTPSDAAPTPSDPAPTPSDAAPTPSDAGWAHHPGTNCFQGVGGEPLPGKDPVRGDFTASECKALCAEDTQCAGVVVVNNLDKYKCWQRRALTIGSCAQSGQYDVWERIAANGNAPVVPVEAPVSTSPPDPVIADEVPVSTSPPSSDQPASPAGTWRHHRGTNCFAGNGGVGLPGKNPMQGDYTPSECKALCEEDTQCVGVVVVNTLDKYKCWQRSALTIENCPKSSDYDVWERA